MLEEDVIKSDHLPYSPSNRIHCEDICLPTVIWVLTCAARILGVSIEKLEDVLSEVGEQPQSQEDRYINELKCKSLFLGSYTTGV